MNKSLLTLAVLTCVGVLSAQTTIYVSPSGGGGGSGWDDPTDLRSALQEAQPGDQVWLATGRYVTTTDGNRDATFIIPSGVKVMGGFSGVEGDAAQRNAKRNPTTLSGEINGPHAEDNAFTVVTFNDANADTQLDGIIIERGYASGAGPTADARRAGGGALIRVTEPGASAMPMLVNCIFRHNYARDGGAVYVDGRGGVANPTFVGCQFMKNEADLDGGAIYNDARSRGHASPSLVDCTFEGNIANYGGAIFNQATKGVSSPRLSRCSFADNHAYIRGESMYNLEYQGENRPVLVDCHFDDLPEDTGTDAEDLVRSVDER